MLLKTPTMMARCHCSNTLCAVLLVLATAVSATSRAQDCRVGSLPLKNEKLSAHSIMLGVLEVKDGFMSPLKYRGPMIDFASEVRRSIGCGESWYRTSFFKLGFSPTTNHSDNGSMLALDINWRMSWERAWLKRDNLSITAGPQIFTKVGGLYNSRNSNNPAVPKVYLAASVAGQAVYGFRLWNYPMALEWRAELPLIGYNFSPTYGLQYYEMVYVDSFSEASHLAWPGNLNNFCQRLSLDIPMGGVQLRLSWYGDYFHYDIGGLDCRIYENSCMIGVVRRFEIKYNGR